MQQSGQSGKSYLGGNRANDADLRVLRANKSPKARAKMHQTVTKQVDSSRR